MRSEQQKIWEAYEGQSLVQEGADLIADITDFSQDVPPHQQNTLKSLAILASQYYNERYGEPEEPEDDYDYDTISEGELANIKNLSELVLLLARGDFSLRTDALKIVLICAFDLLDRRTN